MPEYDVAFVDSIAASPTVRLDLHSASGGWSVLADGTEFPPPELARVVAESMLADGGTVPSAAYRNRTIFLSLELSTSAPADTAVTFVQALARELDRDGGNILRYRPDTSTPVFFRTFRSGFEAVNWDPVTRRARVRLLAEPFAYGPKETVSAATVTNNPAAASNGMFFDIASPKGDVETPLYLAITGTMGVTGRLNSGIAVRRRGTPSAAPFLLQAEAMTQGTDTTVQANSASFSGAGSNWSRCTFATLATGQQRLTSATFPSSPSVDARGTYRTFVRLRQTTGTDSIDVQLQWGTSGNIISNDIVRVPGDTQIKYIDLGLVQLPPNFDPKNDGLSNVEIPVAGTFLALYARRNSGAGNLDFDHLLFMPADDRMLFVRWPTVQAAVDDIFVVEGGPRPAAYCTTVGGNMRSTQPIELVGGGPMITPGRTNRVYFARDLGTGVSTAGSSDSLSATNGITASYFPRYLLAMKPALT